MKFTLPNTTCGDKKNPISLDEINVVSSYCGMLHGNPCDPKTVTRYTDNARKSADKEPRASHYVPPTLNTEGSLPAHRCTAVFLSYDRLVTIVWHTNHSSFEDMIGDIGDLDWPNITEEFSW
jgi:hypothetical protein